MDVSGWTIDQRMRFPEWVYGNQKVIACAVGCDAADTDFWGISSIALPDPVAIFSVGWFMKQDSLSASKFRIGLRATVPTSTAEMDTAIPLLPYLGDLRVTPPWLRVSYAETVLFQFALRKGMATGGLKLVAEMRATVIYTTGNFFVVCSELPTSMAGWLAHNKV